MNAPRRRSRLSSSGNSCSCSGTSMWASSRGPRSRGQQLIPLPGHSGAHEPLFCQYGFDGSIVHRQRLPKVKPGSGSARWKESKRVILNLRQDQREFFWTLGYPSQN